MAPRREPPGRSGHARLVPRREGPLARPVPMADPRLARPPAAPDPRLARAARRAGLVLAVVGVSWIAATWAGEAWGWTQRTRALLDLFALAGFGGALYLTWQVWRLRQAHGG